MWNIWEKKSERPIISTHIKDIPTHSNTIYKGEPVYEVKTKREKIIPSSYEYAYDNIHPSSFQINREEHNPFAFMGLRNENLIWNNPNFYLYNRQGKSDSDFLIENFQNEMLGGFAANELGFIKANVNTDLDITDIQGRDAGLRKILESIKGEEKELKQYEKLNYLLPEQIDKVKNLNTLHDEALGVIGETNQQKETNMRKREKKPKIKPMVLHKSEEKELNDEEEKTSTEGVRKGAETPTDEGIYELPPAEEREEKTTTEGYNYGFDNEKRTNDDTARKLVQFLNNKNAIVFSPELKKQLLRETGNNITRNNLMFEKCNTFLQDLLNDPNYIKKYNVKRTGIAVIERMKQEFTDPDLTFEEYVKRTTSMKSPKK